MKYIKEYEEFILDEGVFQKLKDWGSSLFRSTVGKMYIKYNNPKNMIEKKFTNAADVILDGVDEFLNSNGELLWDKLLKEKKEEVRNFIATYNASSRSHKTNEQELYDFIKYALNKKEDDGDDGKSYNSYSSKSYKTKFRR